MRSIDGLQKRIEAIVSRVEERQNAALDQDIEEIAQADTEESLWRKLEVFLDISLTPAERDARCRAIDAEIDARKTPAEREAVRRYWDRMLCGEDPTEQIMQKLRAIRAAHEREHE